MQITNPERFIILVPGDASGWFSSALNNFKRKEHSKVFSLICFFFSFFSEIPKPFVAVVKISIDDYPTDFSDRLNILKGRTNNLTLRFLTPTRTSVIQGSR